MVSAAETNPVPPSVTVEEVGASPLLLTTAFLLCLFALLVAWKGGPA